MFTGIVEGMGRISRIEGGSGGRTLSIQTNADWLREVVPGASVSVDGACLTPVAVDADGFTVEVVQTTLSRTIVGGYEIGTRVNLERALSLSDRLDGHLVQGHVDGIGHISTIRDRDGFHVLEVTVPPEVHETTLTHGSIALNGVSLTVNRMSEGNVIEVAIIPHTSVSTNLTDLEVGDPVNVEGDLIGKYVGKLLRGALGKSQTERSLIEKSQIERTQEGHDAL